VKAVVYESYWGNTAAASKGQRFLVKMSYGPVKDGELDRAKTWGSELAKAVGK